jgi:acetaldehyde dehydrogenase/alcohol dehydrogenase
MLEPHVQHQVDQMVARAVLAQRAFAGWPEARVDALLGDIAECVADHAEALAVATVAETGLGNVEDKIAKNRLASRAVYGSLVGKPGAGVLRVDEERGIAELASPMGVVFGMVPRTHPVATFAFKALIALKARNALILSSHREAHGVTSMVGDLIVEVLEQHVAPRDLLQWPRFRTGRESTLAFMQHPDVAFVLATGGADMVRAAYSSGTPAIGVGPGNAPTWVCADADVDQAARMVVASKGFDHGVVCAGEHNLLVDQAVADAFVAALQRHGAYVLQSHEVAAFVDAVFDAAEGHVRRIWHGKSALAVAQAGGLALAAAVRLIVVPAQPEHADGPLGREKMAPITSLFVVASADQALSLSQRLLANEGAGHTAIIHTHDQARIARFSRELPVSRILVNVPGTHGTLGIGTGLPPTMTLGTGTFGGTSTTDSIGYLHLLNVKRVAYSVVRESGDLSWDGLSSSLTRG